MTRIYGIPLCLLSLLAVGVASAFAEERTAPNVLFIAVDDLNDWVGILEGHPQAKTPRIDGLAQRGVLFTKAYCSAPGCNASRTSLLMGLRPSTTGIYQNGHDWRNTSLRREAVHLPMHFRNQGYVTLGAGKLFHAHTFFDEKNLSGYSDPGAWEDYFPSLTQQMPAELTPNDWPVNTRKEFYGGHFDWSPLDITKEQMADGQVVAWASEQLQKEHDRPLFLSVGIYRPHVPWYVPRRYFEMFPLESIQLPESSVDDLADIPAAGRALTRRKWHKWIVETDQWKEAIQAYLASLAFADAMVGQLLDSLNEGPLADNTIVMLWGDHGYHLGEKQHWEKFALWEDTTHVPLIVSFPGVVPQGTRCNGPVSLLDIYPTLTEMCRLPPPPQKLEGRSLAGLLRRPQDGQDRVAISTQGRNNHAVRSSRYRYIRYANGDEELYDHQQDPHEWRNLAGDPMLQPVKAELASYLPQVNVPPIGR